VVRAALRARVARAVHRELLREARQLRAVPVQLVVLEVHFL
jgi:hypothetical protein